MRVAVRRYTDKPILWAYCATGTREGGTTCFTTIANSHMPFCTARLLSQVVRSYDHVWATFQWALVPGGVWRQGRDGVDLEWGWRQICWYFILFPILELSPQVHFDFHQQNCWNRSKVVDPFGKKQAYPQTREQMLPYPEEISWCGIEVKKWSYWVRMFSVQISLFHELP